MYTGLYLHLTHLYSFIVYFQNENTYPAIIGITDDRGNKVFTGFSNNLKKSHQCFLPIIGRGRTGFLISTVIPMIAV